MCERYSRFNHKLAKLFQEELIHIILVQMISVAVEVKCAMNDSWEGELDLGFEETKKPIDVFIEILTDCYSKIILVL